MLDLLLAQLLLPFLNVWPPLFGQILRFVEQALARNGLKLAKRQHAHIELAVIKRFDQRGIVSLGQLLVGISPQHAKQDGCFPAARFL